MCACACARADGVCARAGGAAGARGARPDRGGVQPAGGGLGHPPPTRQGTRYSHFLFSRCNHALITLLSLFPYIQPAGLEEAVEGFTPAFGASLFGAAAAFLRSGAWAALPADAPLRVHYRISLEAVPGADATGLVTARVQSFLVRTGEGPGSAEGCGVSIYGSLEEAVGAIAAAAAAAAGEEDAAGGVEAPTRGQSLTFVGAAAKRGSFLRVFAC
jgi:hypothetical protein